MPLQLTDLATVVAAYALWSQKHWAYALTYYWGLVLSTQALISPALQGPDFPHYQFLAFWAIHLIVVWAAIYLTWGRGMRPDWRSYRFAVVVTLVWAVVTFTFNSIAGTNYGFLNRKPSTASLLDVLGPWPWYVFIGATLILCVWALMTWPWERMAVVALGSSLWRSPTTGRRTRARCRRRNVRCGSRSSTTCSPSSCERSAGSRNDWISCLRAHRRGPGARSGPTGKRMLLVLHVRVRIGRRRCRDAYRRSAEHVEVLDAIEARVDVDVTA